MTIEELKNSDVKLCQDLCNELMTFQKAKAFLYPENFEGMNFDTRMLKSYENALEKQVLIAKDGNIPVGYVFSTIDLVEENDRNHYPDWAPKLKDAIGFYPNWVKLPKKIGCLNNLYLREEYRSTGVGSRLFDEAMKWLENFSDTNLTFVYISNGNDKALDFYLKHGFTYSHDVFGGFIKAAYKLKDKSRS